MIKNNPLGRTLLLAQALVVFVAARGEAQLAKQAPKASKAASAKPMAFAHPQQKAPTGDKPPKRK
jgi:hypothetical protein